MTGFDDLKRSLADWCSVAAERASETAKVTSRRYDKFALGREIERTQAELGALVYRGIISGQVDILSGPRVGELVAAVTALERERELKDDEIAGIRRDYDERRSAGTPGAGGAAGSSPGGMEAGRAGDEAVSERAAESGDRRPDFSG